MVELVALLAWSVILYQAGDGLQILFANALRGISDVKYMAYMAFFCHFGLALPIGYLCGFTFGWGPSVSGAASRSADHARTVTLETFQSIDNKKIGYD